jgi:hypothetical protein
LLDEFVKEVDGKIRVSYTQHCNNMILYSANSSLGHITAVIVRGHVLQGDGWSVRLAVLHE